MRKGIEAALAKWREAIRLRDAASDDDRDDAQAAADQAGAEFQQLSAQHMMSQIDALKEAEKRRKSETPSSPPFHEAARDEKRIAADIWENARMSDEDTPRVN